MFRSGFKTQFPLRTAAISSRGVIGSKFVLDVALATPAAILNLRLARENFARSRDESSFGTTSSIPHHFSVKLTIGATCIACHLFIRHRLFCLRETYYA
jgi:hypothetical protein